MRPNMMTLNCPSSSGLTAQEAAGFKRGSRSKSQYMLACLAGQGSLAASVLPVGIVPAQTSWPKLQALTDLMPRSCRTGKWTSWPAGDAIYCGCRSREPAAGIECYLTTRSGHRKGLSAKWREGRSARGRGLSQVTHHASSRRGTASLRLVNSIPFGRSRHFRFRGIISLSCAGF